MAMPALPSIIGTLTSVPSAPLNGWCVVAGCGAVCVRAPADGMAIGTDADAGDSTRLPACALSAAYSARAKAALSAASTAASPCSTVGFSMRTLAERTVVTGSGPPGVPSQPAPAGSAIAIRAASAADVARVLTRPLSLFFREDEGVARAIDGHGVTRADLARQNLLGQRVAHPRLQRAFDRPGAVHRVVALGGDQGARRIGQRQVDALLAVQFRQTLHLQVDPAG